MKLIALSNISPKNRRAASVGGDIEYGSSRPVSVGTNYDISNNEDSIINDLMWLLKVSRFVVLLFSFCSRVHGGAIEVAFFLFTPSVG